MSVATNQWYDLRLEVIGKLIRGYVNGDLKFELNDSSLPATGSSGVLMYKPIFGPTFSTSHERAEMGPSSLRRYHVAGCDQSRRPLIFSARKSPTLHDTFMA